MRLLIIAALATAVVAPASADTLCNQLKVLEKAGDETPRFASLVGETIVDPFSGRYVMGTLEPKGLPNCLIKESDPHTRTRYECTGPSFSTANDRKATFDKLAKGVEACFKAKGEKAAGSDYTLITYKLDEVRIIGVGLTDEIVSLAYYPKPG